MKKVFILTLVMGLLLAITGCGNTKKEANEVETEMMTNTTYEQEYETTEDDTEYVTEEDFEFTMYISKLIIMNKYDEVGISEDCKNELMKIIDSVEYDPTQEYGCDMNSIEIKFVNTYVKYGILPEECTNCTIDEVIDLGYEDLIL